MRCALRIPRSSHSKSSDDELMRAIQAPLETVYRANCSRIAVASRPPFVRGNDLPQKSCRRRVVGLNGIVLQEWDPPATTMRRPNDLERPSASTFSWDISKNPG